MSCILVLFLLSLTTSRFTLLHETKADCYQFNPEWHLNWYYLVEDKIGQYLENKEFLLFWRNLCLLWLIIYNLGLYFCNYNFLFIIFIIFICTYVRCMCVYIFLYVYMDGQVCIHQHIQVGDGGWYWVSLSLFILCLRYKLLLTQELTEWRRLISQ